MKNLVKVSAPGKLMLFGEHAVVYGRPCIVTAVDQRLSCEIRLREDGLLTINAKDVNLVGYKKNISELGLGDVEKSAKFIEFAVRNFLEKYPNQIGLEVITHSEFKSTFGFGSSSAVTVCLIKGLSEIFELNLSNKEIFDLSYKTILDVQGKGSGFDVASATYGGLLCFQNAGEILEPLIVSEGFELVVGYSGTKADTVEMIDKVLELEKKDPNLVKRIYSKMGEVAESAKKLIKKSSWQEVGDLMNQNQKLLVQLGVSTDRLNEMCKSSLSAGALGAKLSGAGGGDCMIALTDRLTRQNVVNAINNSGGEYINVGINAEGVRID